MAWTERSKLSERVRFIAAFLKGDETVTCLAIRFGVSRKTAYKWINRYRDGGPAGLHDLSHAPLQPGHKTAVEITGRIIALRRKRPAWGPRKLRARLILDEPETAWPAASTIGDILKREGLVRPRKFRRRVPPMEHPFADAAAPNDLWCIDFKGHWKTGDGVRFEPFTVSDAMSRYLLVCKAVARPNYATVWPMMAKAFRDYGLPSAVRSDNGPPFGSVAAGGLSRLGVNLVKMGIMPERIEPGKPQQNGRHERMHQTLKREAATPPSRTAQAQAARMARFRRVFNNDRPHEALGQIPPASVYTPSPRIWDGKLRSPDYLAADHVRKVRHCGTIRWQGHELFISETLKGEPVGLFEISEDTYGVRFGPILLGHIDGKKKMHRLKPQRNRRTKPENCYPSNRSEM